MFKTTHSLQELAKIVTGKKLRSLTDSEREMVNKAFIQQKNFNKL